MNNIAEFRSANFGEFLLTSRLVASGKEKFMIHWTGKFFEFWRRHPKITWSELLPLYLKELNNTACQDWQIRQADQAVRLYFSNFLMAQSSSAELGPVTASEKPSSQETSLKTFQEALRLRNYSLRTEKTYLHWVARYFRYCNKRGLGPSVEPQRCSEMVRDFLASLVMTENVSASTQNQAFNSLLMFFRLVFNQELGDLKHALRARVEPDHAK